MPNYAQLVSQIRTLLAGSNFTRDARLEGLARDYAYACQAASERLVVCQEFLNKGLRCEAVYHAQLPPDLLDSLGALDFPERDRWDELAATYGLPDAPRPNSHGAEALNRAFAEHAEIEPLVTRLRRLALAQGSVSERLQVLQTLMKLDPLNPVWTESIGDFEKSRLKELDRDIDLAIRNRDTKALQTLQGELTSGWITQPPPATLLNSVQKALKNCVYAEQLRQLEALTGELTAAFAHRQIDQVKDMLERWRNLTQKMEGEVPATIHAKVKPVLAWNAKEIQRVATDGEYRAALDDMTASLEHNRTPETLRLKWKALEEYRRAIPVDVRDRYHGAIEEIEHSKVRRYRKWAVWGGVGCVLLVATLWLNGYRRGLEQQFQASVKQLTNQLDNGNLVEAELFYQSLERAESASAMERQEMVQQKLRLAKFKKAEVDRREHFASLLAEVQADPGAVEGAPSVVKARRAAKTDDEKLAINRLVGERKERSTTEQLIRDRAYDEEYRRVTAAVKDSEKGLEGAALEEKLDEVERSLQKLDVLAKNVSSDVSVVHPILRAKAVELRKRAATAAKTEARFAQMNQAFRENGVDIDAYLQALQGLVDTAPNAEFAGEVQRALTCDSIWRAIHHWNQGFANKKTPGPEEFARYLKMPVAPKHPDFAIIEAQGRFRHHDAAELTRRYREIFESPLMTELWKFKAKARPEDTNSNGDYYTSDLLLKKPLDEVKEATRLIGAQVTLVTADVILDYGYKPDVKKTGARRTLLYTTRVRAPHSVLAEEALAAIEKANMKDPAAVVQILALVRDKEQLDPIAHLRLLRDLVKATSNSSPCLGALCADHEAAIKAFKVDLAVPWMNPEDPRTQTSHPRAFDELVKFPRFRLAAAKLPKMLDEKNVELQRTLATPVGYLMKVDREWRIQPQPKVSSDYRLVAAWKNANGGGEWIPLGRIYGQASVSAPPVSLPQGTLVYSLPSP
ncbi:MAG: hypothetical protein WCL32_15135 [Planctomycetota bacterium]